MTSITVGESRTRITVGNTYIVRPGSSLYDLHVTVTDVGPAAIAYTYTYPNGAPATGTGVVSPSRFAYHYIWHACAQKVA